MWWSLLSAPLTSASIMPLALLLLLVTEVLQLLGVHHVCLHELLLRVHAHGWHEHGALRVPVVRLQLHPGCGPSSRRGRLLHAWA